MLIIRDACDFLGTVKAEGRLARRIGRLGGKLTDHGMDPVAAA